MNGSHRNVLGGLALLMALGLGFIGGQSFGRPAQGARSAADPRSCQQAVERLASIEERLASLGHAATSRDEPTSMPSPAVASEEGVIVARLESLRGRVEDLMALPLCQAGAPGPHAAETRDLAKLDDPRNRQAFGDARSVVDYAIQDGRWTRDDAESLRELLPLLTGEQQEEVLAALLPELNANLEVDFFPPF